MNICIIFQGANQATNYGSWGKKKKNADWSTKETVKFYKALSVFGTDFSLMEGVFKKRSRHELKRKFKKEQNSHMALVDKCLNQGQTFDPSIFDSENEDSETEESAAEKKKKEKENRRKSKQNEKKPTKRRHRVKGRRFYDSEDADESEVDPTTENSSEAGNILEAVNVNKQTKRKRKSTDRNSLEETQETTAELPVAKKSKPPTLEEPSLLKSILSQGASGSLSNASKTTSNFAIPPALLAANPGLANAAPGSLVVVASPASPANPAVSSANAQLLEVFMVTDEETDGGETPNVTEKSTMPKRTRTISENRLDTTSIGRVRTHSGTFQ